MPKMDDSNNNFQTKFSKAGYTYKERQQKNKQNPSLKQEQRLIRAGGDSFCVLPFNAVEKNQS